ncbi:ubiquitin carboxyl-terminal hydrolase 13-like [Fundulus heteroclitus]|uniref:ubiquitin carboxyl-terminal hydrolase 13-like n=1 Tax=Fundulus heteroclitus TaxID=8078 RepID=UPI00165CB234|nr:ubiquitin carboxyl-terminal hydrolase 13-like [Fundulus heteroclitus]
MSGPRVKDGPGRYELFAFISHMGASTMSGHYVCHIKKEGRWVIYNDHKVCLSERPPKDLGYIYFYTVASRAVKTTASLLPANL